MEPVPLFSNIIRVIHVDDEAAHRKITKILLERNKKIEVTSIASAEEALKLLEKEKPDCIVSDYMMPVMDGLTFAKRVRERSNVPFIFYTGRGSEEVAEAAFANGVDSYLRKEIEPSQYLVLEKQILNAVQKHRTEEHYKALVEGIREAFVMTSDLKILFANDSMTELLEAKNTDQLIGADISTWVVGGEPSFSNWMYDITLRHSQNIFTLKKPNGEKRSIKISKTLVDYNGRPASLLFFYDITEQVNAENIILNEVEETRNYVTKMKEANRHAVEIAQADTVEQICNATLDTIEAVIVFKAVKFIVKENESLRIVGSRGIKQSHPLKTFESTGIISRAIREKHSILQNDLRNDPDFIAGLNDFKSELVVPIVLGDEVLAVIDAQSIDLDAFTYINRELLETLAIHIASAVRRNDYIAKLREADAVKAREILRGIDLVARNVRHDLRGPLQVIRNVAFITARNPESMKEMEGMIIESVEYANRILEDLSIISVPTKLETESVDLNDLVARTLKTVSIPGSINVESKMSESPIPVNVDLNRIERVLNNMIKNSVEAMPKGGKLSVVVTREDGWVTISVADTGKGMSPEAQKKMFTPFFSTKVGGSGLGLTFGKQVIEAHGGTISYETAAGVGTTFTLKLPEN